MIRTTYKGRQLKILTSRTPGCVRQFIGGQIIHHAFLGTEVDALDNLRIIIDRIDHAGGPGYAPHLPYPHWYEPGTYALNGFGHVVPQDGIGGCPCDLCLMWPAKNVRVKAAA